MLSGIRADAEDLVQAALQNYLALAEINGHAAIDALSGCASIRTYRGAPPSAQAFPTDEPPDQAAADHACEGDMLDVVRRALDRLPQRMRAAVMLRYFEGMTEPEIAARSGSASAREKHGVTCGGEACALTRNSARIPALYAQAPAKPLPSPAARTPRFCALPAMAGLAVARQGLLPGA